MVDKDDRISIKIVGEKDRVERVSKKISEIFPISLEGKMKPNDSGTGYYTFLTVCCPKEE